MANWYYKNGEEQVGPVNDQELQSAVGNNKVVADTMIRQGETGGWFRADLIQGLLPPPKPPVFSSTANAGSSGKIGPVENFGIGGIAVLVIACLGILSFFLSWQEVTLPIVGHLTKNGFKTGAFLFGFVFVYPVIAVLLKKPINFFGGYICAAFGVFLGIFFIVAFCEEYILEHVVNTSSTGPYLFICLNLALAVAVFIQRKEHGATVPAWIEYLLSLIANRGVLMVVGAIVCAIVLLGFLSLFV